MMMMTIEKMNGTHKKNDNMPLTVTVEYDNAYIL